MIVMSKEDYGGYDYLLSASKHVKGDGDHWLRYLYKVIQKDKIKLTSDDVERLLDSPALTLSQKLMLQDALTAGTYIHNHVIHANEPYVPRDMIALIKERMVSTK